MFYDHAFDNYRILGILLKAWRTQKDITQEKLAMQSQIPKGLVSAAENLPSVLSAPNDTRRLSREILLKILLGVNPTDLEKKVDILLWLFDGNFLEKWEGLKLGLEKAEGRHKVGRKEDEEKSFHENDLRKEVLNLLKKALNIFTEDAETNRRMVPKLSAVKVIGYRGEHGENFDPSQLIKSGDYKDNVGDELVEMEKTEGVRLLVRPLPSFVILKNLTVLDGKIVRKERKSKLGTQRVDLFFSHIKKFGIRSIHEIDTISNYLLLTDEPDLEAEEKRKTILERRGQIEALIGLMEQYDKFQIRLAKSTSPFNFQITGMDTVILSPSTFMGKKAKEKFKTSYIKRIKLTGEENVLPFLIEFESLWCKLSEHQSKETVISKLREMLEQTPN